MDARCLDESIHLLRGAWKRREMCKHDNFRQQVIFSRLFMRVSMMIAADNKRPRDS